MAIAVGRSSGSRAAAGTNRTLTRESRIYAFQDAGLQPGLQPDDTVSGVTA
jgi:hypothetical protein